MVDGLALLLPEDGLLLEELEDGVRLAPDEEDGLIELPEADDGRISTRMALS